MTAKYLLDASAMLAWLQNEPGSERVEAVLDECVISAINAAEVMHKLVRNGAAPDRAQSIFDQTLIPVVDFTAGMARLMPPFSAQDKHLSLGDRACLATAQAQKLVALSADKRWAQLPFPGLFEMIR